VTEAYGTELGAAEGKGVDAVAASAGATKEAGAEVLFRPIGGFRRYLSNIGAVMWKDILSEYRSREVVVTMIVFALLVIVMFNFAFELGERWKASVGSGILWTAILFSSVLGMNRTFALEKEGECIQGLLLSPADRSALFLGKLAANLIFLLILEAVFGDGRACDCGDAFRRHCRQHQGPRGDVASAAFSGGGARDHGSRRGDDPDSFGGGRRGPGHLVPGAGCVRRRFFGSIGLGG
jgi:hypothetical protein